MTLTATSSPVSRRTTQDTQTTAVPTREATALLQNNATTPGATAVTPDAAATVPMPRADPRRQADARQVAQNADAATRARVNNAVPGGTTAAPELQNTNRAREVNPAITNGPEARSAANLDRVINQFDVANNPRYAPSRNATYCNIFASDVMGAMGAPLPHWVDQNNNPATSRTPGAREMNANATVNWLNNEGARHGWRQITAEEAQARANQGHPTIAIWKNPTGASGHVGVIRPGEMTDQGPAMAQAGRRNSNDTHVHASPAGFGNKEVQYWTHDPPPMVGDFPDPGPTRMA